MLAVYISVLTFFSNSDPLEGKQLLMQVEISILIPGSYHKLAKIVETDGLRTNIQFLQPARDTTNSKRLDGSALT